MSLHFLRRAFHQIRYTFQDNPPGSMASLYGIYIHIPFCHSFCAFCPFYKEHSDPVLIEQYIQALETEIQKSPLDHSPQWIYIGGGTPNVLSLSQLQRIFKAFAQKGIQLQNIGLELLPSLLTLEYFQGLAPLSVSKVSMGVESLSKSVLTSASRPSISPEKLQQYIDFCRNHGIFVNLDLMIGLDQQDQINFLTDITTLAAFQPSQITIYPYMVIRGISQKSSMRDDAQFALIEVAADHLINVGYTRQSPWVFTRDLGLYDSSRDELVHDYIGFGAGAFSSYSGYRRVNPILPIYLHGIRTNTSKALVTEDTPHALAWRHFARMIYDLKLASSSSFPPMINYTIWLLQLGGFAKNGSLTPRGMNFAHHLTKCVVENLPFPLQNPKSVTNFEESHKIT